jgi:ABC-type glycerol-3-phosphate transport system substrate-binding protein
MQTCAMEFNGIVRHNTIKPFVGEHLAYVPPPRGVKQTASLGGNAYSIMALSKNRDLAWDFLMWLHSREGFLDTPQFDTIAWPPTLWAAREPTWLERFKGTNITDVIEVWEKHGHDRLVTPEAEESWALMNEPITRAVRGELSPRDAMRESAAKLNELYSRRPPEAR